METRVETLWKLPSLDWKPLGNSAATIGFQHSLTGNYSAKSAAKKARKAEK